MLLDPVFPKVCSADHLWSARSGQVVRELQYKLLDYANARYFRTLTCSSLWKRLKTTTRSSRFSTFWDCIDVVVVVAVTQLNECKLCKTVFSPFLSSDPEGWVKQRCFWMIITQLIGCLCMFRDFHTFWDLFHAFRLYPSLLLWRHCFMVLTQKVRFKT